MNKEAPLSRIEKPADGDRAWASAGQRSFHRKLVDAPHSLHQRRILRFYTALKTARMSAGGHFLGDTS